MHITQQTGNMQTLPRVGHLLLPHLRVKCLSHVFVLGEAHNSGREHVQSMNSEGVMPKVTCLPGGKGLMETVVQIGEHDLMVAKNAIDKSWTWLPTTRFIRAPPTNRWYGSCLMPEGLLIT